jgi:hypothetical protein
MFPVWFRSLSHRRTLAKLLQQAGEAQHFVVEDIPSMIWMSEQQFLYLLAREYFLGIGVIVDAGIFLGSSTRTFTAGLRDRPDLDRLLAAGRPVRSYDLGLCDDHMASLTNTHYGTSYKSGDSFLEILQHNIQGCEDCVQFFAGDIKNQTIDSLIEMLFLDVCKTPELNAHIIKEFFPRLIPGHSVLIQQDFVHELLPWLHVTMGLLKPYFRFLGVVGESPSAVWLNTRKIPSPTPWEKEGGNDLYWTAPLPRLLELFERGIEPLTSEKQRYLVELAKSRMIAERGDKPGALRLLERLDLRFDQLHGRPSYYPRPAVLKDFIESCVR